MTATTAPERPATDRRLTFRRSERSTVLTSSIVGFAILVLAALPYLVYRSVTDTLVMFFVLLTISSMWNLLAGFGGLVSVGQQAYIGLGAYAVLALSDAGVQPYVGVALAAVVCAVIALPTSLLAFRLRGDYFAVGTWVIAEVYRLFIVQVDALGGGSGRSLTTLSGLDIVVRQAVTYWVALAVAVLGVGVCYWLLRGRLGLALTAVRDNEVSAASAGVRVTRAKQVVYLISAAGCGAAGGVLIVSSLSVQADYAFTVQWSVFMIFIVIIGGLGYVEGPIIGTIVFFALQQLLGDYGAWYLILLGVLAVVVAIWLPRGLYGVLFDRTGLRLFPVGHHVAGLDDGRRPSTSGRSLVRSVLRR
jgi:branched-chain amino acid transport system permease protein